jgi:hypothetical protein
VPDGRILIIVHDGLKHAPALEICRRTCKVISDGIWEKRTFLILGAKN